MRASVATLLLILAAAPAAGAQPAPPASAAVDVIGTLLRSQTARDEDEPDTAGQPRPAPQLRAAPLGGPVPPPTVGARDLAYDTRLRASFASAQGFQGPLDGGWTLSIPADDGGGDLYALQLVDRADRLEGVWRDLRRQGALNASGLIDDLQRQGRELTLRFTPAPGAPAVVATLHGGADGRWAGELAEGEDRRPLVLRRTGP